MKIRAEIYPHGCEFVLTAECEYEHAILKFLCSTKYDVRGVFHDGERYGAWRPHEPTKASIHLSEMKADTPDAASGTSKESK
jgi:hypothetical protein